MEKEYWVTQATEIVATVNTNPYSRAIADTLFNDGYIDYSIIEATEDHQSQQIEDDFISDVAVALENWDSASASSVVVRGQQAPRME